MLSVAPFLNHVADINYDYTTTTTTTTTSQGGGAVLLVLLLFLLAFAVFNIVCLWRIYQKAGQKGWAALVPIYNIIVLCRIGGKPDWWTILFFVPIANIVVSILLIMEVSRRFGKDPVAYVLLYIFLSPVWAAILAFGSAQYNAGGQAGADNSFGPQFGGPTPLNDPNATNQFNGFQPTGPAPEQPQTAAVEPTAQPVVQPGLPEQPAPTPQPTAFAPEDPQMTPQATQVAETPTVVEPTQPDSSSNSTNPQV